MISLFIIECMYEIIVLTISHLFLCWFTWSQGSIIANELYWQTIDKLSEVWSTWRSLDSHWKQHSLRLFMRSAPKWKLFYHFFLLFRFNCVVVSREMISSRSVTKMATKSSYPMQTMSRRRRFSYRFPSCFTKLFINHFLWVPNSPVYFLLNLFENYFNLKSIRITG